MMASFTSWLGRNGCRVGCLFVSRFSILPWLWGLAKILSAAWFWSWRLYKFFISSSSWCCCCCSCCRLALRKPLHAYITSTKRQKFTFTFTFEIEFTFTIAFASELRLLRLWTAIIFVGQRLLARLKILLLRCCQLWLRFARAALLLLLLHSQFITTNLNVFLCVRHFYVDFSLSFNMQMHWNGDETMKIKRESYCENGKVHRLTEKQKGRYLYV